MNRKECIDELRRISGNSMFLTANQIAEALGVHRGTARQRLYGVPWQGSKTKKQYFIGDVADRLMEGNGRKG